MRGKNARRDFSRERKRRAVLGRRPRERPTWRRRRGSSVGSFHPRRFHGRAASRLPIKEPPSISHHRAQISAAVNQTQETRHCWLALLYTMPPPAGAIKIPPPVQPARRGTTDKDDALLLPLHLPTPSSGAARKRFSLYLAISRHLFAGNGQPTNGGSPKNEVRELSQSLAEPTLSSTNIKYNLSQIDFGNALSSIAAAKYVFCNQEREGKKRRTQEIFKTCQISRYMTLARAEGTLNTVASVLAAC